MWLAALDKVLERLLKSGVDMGRIAAVGGDGQQHGSVYLNDRFDGLLRGLDASRSLAEQLAPALSRPASPIWMDSSTSAEVENTTRGSGCGCRRTPARRVERFTDPNPQFAKTSRSAMLAQARSTWSVHFLFALIGGRCADRLGDGAGMNLLNLRTLAWDEEIAEFTAPDLLRRLPRLGRGAAGPLHPYFAKYGLRAGLPVAVWTGDNPASLVGTGAWDAGVAVVSLGTSDTFFAALSSFHTDPEGCGHVFGNPAGGFMSLPASRTVRSPATACAARRERTGCSLIRPRSS
jgi:xylulokinase